MSKSVISLSLIVIYLVVSFLSPTASQDISRLVLFTLPLVLLLIFPLDTGKWRGPFYKMIVSIVVLMVILAISTTLSVSILTSLPAFFEFLSCFAALIIIRSLEGRSFLNRLISTLIILTIPVGLLFILLKITDLKLYYLNTVIGFSGGHSQFAGWLIIIIPLTVGLLSKANKTLKKILRFSLVFFFILLILTLSRGAWFITSLLVIFYWGDISKKIKPSFLVLLPIILTSGLLVFAYLAETGGVQPQTYRSLTEITREPLNSASRLAVFRQGLKAFIGHPLFGTGPATFNYNPPTIKDRVGLTPYTHNYFLQIASETGIFSVITLLLIFFLILKYQYLSYRRHPDPLRRSSLIAAILSLIYSIFDFNLNHFVILFPLLLIMLSAVDLDDQPKNIKHLSKLKIATYLIGILPVLYLVSSIILPQIGIYLSSDGFQRRLLGRSSDHRKEDRQVIELWLTLDNGNGAAHNFLASYYYDRGNLNQAVSQMLKSTQSNFSRNFDFSLLDKFTDPDVLNRLDYRSHQDLYSLLSYANRYYSGGFSQADVWVQQRQLYVAAKELFTYGSSSLSDDQLAELAKWVIDGEMFLDTQNWLFIKNIIDHHPKVLNDKDYFGFKEFLPAITTESSIEEINKQIQSIKSTYCSAHCLEIHAKLLAYLYLKQSEYYFSKSQGQNGLHSLDLGITVSPLTGSLRVAKIKFLRSSGDIKAAQIETDKCIKIISESCREWINR